MIDNQILLDVRNLSLALSNGNQLVKDVSFTLRQGETVGIVGESGSGKTMVARALMGLEPPTVRVNGGEILFERTDTVTLRPAALRKLRGARIGMVFQEPMTSLNPSMTIGRQLEEGLRLHTKLDAADRRLRMLEMLERVSIKDPQAALNTYPHHFSGGMRQRIMLASAMLLRPALLIADEPTTALDAIVQRDVLDLMKELTSDFGTSVIMISHDLPVVARYTDQIIVMQHGKIVEQNRTRELVSAPRRAYTQKLLAAVPKRGQTRAVSQATPIIEVNQLTVEYPGSKGMLGKRPSHLALKSIDLRVSPGEVVAIVGGSGSGKTTLGRTIAGLIQPKAGKVLFEGREIERGSAHFERYRTQCQMVFQDPASSLDPRMTVEALIGEALHPVRTMTAAAKRERVREVLDEVALGPAYASRYQHELSGGQRQRVAIARAVARRPAFIIADEPVSALDVTVRAQILELFENLQAQHGFSCLFISHDLAVVEQVADRVVVMRNGEIVENSPRDQIFDDPQHAFTKDLLNASMRLPTSSN
ncbi:ABC transporter ATP-binding protein [Ensifer adhaerens]|uniref:dipeptide ABC transporter ATP-binding protein n=1 Tax=Ensifer adhaerens TaxID=106592 RepID=UPI001CBD12D3|nr:ABC transporter ATP-binding protein [Ensifer adhaerens]MBZ7924908.1 ABC transporter ATP-binding protein [Ensifer adhaerens]UAX95878.1 ABC transporter ATP-binding protein [Ensifer adhaerens]UAY04780.1 ABC transporter ATP-binding protein [Ensifer adhaerens]UAY10211.1 ABC transporter ATP-binding protein [Ensifer adhaerens]